MTDRSFATVLLPFAPGAPMAADVHLPPGPGPHPAILWIHGGALIGGRRADIAPDQLERYLAAGLAVVTPDYPLAPESRPEAILATMPPPCSHLAGSSICLSGRGIGP